VMDGGGLMIERKLGEWINIHGDLISIQVIELSATKVKLRFVAPKEIDIERAERKHKRRNPNEPRSGD